MKIEELVEAMVEARIKQIRAVEEYQSLKEKLCGVVVDDTQKIAFPVEDAARIGVKARLEFAENPAESYKLFSAVRGIAHAILVAHGFDEAKFLNDTDNVQRFYLRSEELRKTCGRTRRGTSRAAVRLAAIVCGWTGGQNSRIAAFARYKKLNVEIQDGPESHFDILRNQLTTQSAIPISNEVVFCMAYHLFSGEHAGLRWKDCRSDIMASAITNLVKFVTELNAAKGQQ